MNTLCNALNRLTVAGPAMHRNLALFPLIDAAPVPATYLTLDQALATKVLRITELGSDGSVPELGVRNDGNRPVLLLDGEELVGAKQNRVLNITLLVAAGATMVIPVSCVEKGRWGFRGDKEFASSKRTLFARGRAEKMVDVSFSMRTDNRHESDQSAVWDSIQQRSEEMDTSSPTGAMSDIYGNQQDNLESFEKAFPSLPGQTGAVFVINGKITGCELFDSDTTWTHQASKLIGSYALDALQASNTHPKSLKTASAEAFLHKIANADTTSHDAIGLGRDIRMDSAELIGGALEFDSRIVHLSAFALGNTTATNGTQRRSRFSSLRNRRYHREH